MSDFRWLDRNRIPLNTFLENGIALADRLGQNITWGERDGRWYVWGGEGVLLGADSKEVAEAFVYGIGFAYSVLPDVVFQTLVRHLWSVVGDDEPETDL